MIKRGILYLSAGIVLLMLVAAAGFQLQHLAWSTARVKNQSPYLLSEVLVRVDDAIVRIGEISPGRSRFVRLPARGDATLSIEFSSAGHKYKGCTVYVQGDMYHVRVSVPSDLAVSCRPELGVFTRIMLFELL